jgi:8-oxo-dGTP pyrophosphatase MutT (NUDIX family)
MLCGDLSMTIKNQAGCLPIRGSYPEVEVLLVTSRYTGEWIAPKGSIDPGESSVTAALREAEEEAGVLGRLGRCLGRFEYLRGHQQVSLEMFVLEVTEERGQWPEQPARRRKWFRLDEALRIVQRPEVREMLLRLS